MTTLFISYSRSRTMLVASAGSGKTIMVSLMIALKRLIMRPQKVLKVAYVFPTFVLRDRDEHFV